MGLQPHEFARPFFQKQRTRRSRAQVEYLGSTRRTLRQFIAAVAEMNAIVRDVILPNPDTE